jgi:hypothetical protein
VYARKLKLTPDGGFLHDTGAFRGKPVKIYSQAQGKSWKSYDQNESGKRLII